MNILGKAAKQTALFFGDTPATHEHMPYYAMPAAAALVSALGVGVFAAYLATETGRAILNELKRRQRLREKRPSSPSLRGTPTAEELEKDGALLPRTLAVRLRLGSRLADLEPTLETGLIHKELRNGQKRIKARAPGLKGWLNDRRVSINYSTLVRYKKLAQRLRQLLELDDRLPLEWLLPEAEPDREIQAELHAQFASGRRNLGRLMREHRSFSCLSRYVEAKLGIPQLLSVRRAKHRAREDAWVARRRKKMARDNRLATKKAMAVRGGYSVTLQAERVEATKRELIRFLQAEKLPGPLRHLRNKAAHWLRKVGRGE